MKPTPAATAKKTKRNTNEAPKTALQQAALDIMNAMKAITNEAAKGTRSLLRERARIQNEILKAEDDIKRAEGVIERLKKKQKENDAKIEEAEAGAIEKLKKIQINPDEEKK